MIDEVANKSKSKSKPRIFEGYDEIVREATGHSLEIQALDALAQYARNINLAHNIDTTPQQRRIYTDYMNLSMAFDTKYQGY